MLGFEVTFKASIRASGRRPAVEKNREFLVTAGGKTQVAPYQAHVRSVDLDQLAFIPKEFKRFSTTSLASNYQTVAPSG